MTFTREPIIGGDRNTWAAYNTAQLRRSEGICTSQLYSDAGVLKLSPGIIGLNDDTNRGVIEIDTVQTISVVGLTASRWAQVEIYLTAGVVTVIITSIAAGSSPSSVPTEFDSAFNGLKGGFYINSTKRCLGLAWINASGALEGVISAVPGFDGYGGWSISDDANDNKYHLFKENNNSANIFQGETIDIVDVSGNHTVKRVYTKKIPIGSWDMDSVSVVNLLHGIAGLNPLNTISLFFIIQDDAGGASYYFGNGLQSTVVSDNMLGVYTITSTFIKLMRVDGSFFDSSTFDDSSINRGFLVIKYHL